MKPQLTYKLMMKLAVVMSIVLLMSLLVTARDNGGGNELGVVNEGEDEGDCGGRDQPGQGDNGGQQPPGGNGGQPPGPGGNGGQQPGPGGNGGQPPGPGGNGGQQPGPGGQQPGTGGGDGGWGTIPWQGNFPPPMIRNASNTLLCSTTLLFTCVAFLLLLNGTHEI